MSFLFKVMSLMRMSKTYPVRVLVMIFLIWSYGSASNAQYKDDDVSLAVFLEQDDKEPLLVAEIKKDNSNISKVVDGIRVAISVTEANNQIRVNVIASAKEKRNAFITLRLTTNSGEFYSYSGIENKESLFRQSPHDPMNHVFPNLKAQAVPMVAVKIKDTYTTLISDAPAFYDNYTTQYINPNKNIASISSGDNGKDFSNLKPDAIIKSYYPELNKQKSHHFNAIIFKSKNIDNLNDLREEVLKNITTHWGDKSEINRFYATSFGSNYMHLRKNEKNNSEYWIVPGIEYSNKQYSRDAFWQSMILPPKFEAECYKNEAVDQTPGAERPLFALIWAYRIAKNGGKPNLQAAKNSLKYIEEHVRNGKYYAANDPVKKNYQSWYDLVAFEDDDVIAYNQGLLAVALMSAQELGLKSQIPLELVISNYKNMFNKKGYYPLSEQKDIICLDATIGDLLSQLLFDKKLLPDADVQQSFATAKKLLKTPFGYKITAKPNGAYASYDDYTVPNFKVDVSEGGGIGNYQWGGSWYLYDMLFLINAYLHDSPGALEEVLWRGKLDFDLGGTYFEYNNTVTGKSYKANQGWNAAIYSIWNSLINKGLATDKLFEVINSN